MSELRITDTNSVNDSKGRAFGLEGNDFIYVVIAIVVALAFHLVFWLILRVGLIVSLLFSLPVLGVTIVWILLFRRGKPEGYAGDFFDQLINREGWSYAPRRAMHDARKESYVRHSS